jgi:hypothetical protein
MAIMIKMKVLDLTLDIWLNYILQLNKINNLGNSGGFLPRFPPDLLLKMQFNVDKETVTESVAWWFWKLFLLIGITILMFWINIILGIVFLLLFTIPAFMHLTGDDDTYY